MIEFQYPLILFGLLIVPLLILWYYYFGKHKEGVMRYSDISLIPDIFIKRAKNKVKLVIFIKIIIILFIIVALSRPRMTDMIIESTTDIVDIMLVIDMSSSMLAEDFKPILLVVVEGPKTEKE